MNQFWLQDEKFPGDFEKKIILWHYGTVMHYVQLSSSAKRSAGLLHIPVCIHLSYV